MKRSVCLIALLLVAALCLATSSVFAADISPHAPDFDDPQRQAEVDEQRCRSIQQLQQWALRPAVSAGQQLLLRSCQRSNGC